MLEILLSFLFILNFVEAFDLSKYFLEFKIHASIFFINLFFSKKSKKTKVIIFKGQKNL